ncbi:hypothetical protein ACFL23_02550 [Patescibacteria group bacterium]
MENFERIYNIFWSILSTCGGFVLIFGRRWFLNASSRFYLRLHEKTKLSLFKRMSDNLLHSHMYLLVVVIGIISIILGVKLFIKQFGLL